MEQPVVLLSTASSTEEGSMIARVLVEERLAACCNLVPGIRSIYRWEGKVEESEEVLLVIKSLAGQVDALRSRLVEIHSYRTPELVVLPIVGGLDSYLQWIADNTG
jgi:periplasmic divalent cation tolerance protein